MEGITIRIKEHGPYVIEAEEADRVTILDFRGEVVKPTPGKRISLCRCGLSLKKPFCDATHRTSEFNGTLCEREPAAP